MLFDSFEIFAFWAGRDDRSQIYNLEPLTVEMQT